ncbi:MAG: holo-ACP synthase [Rubrobacter sp.]
MQDGTSRSELENARERRAGGREFRVPGVGVDVVDCGRMKLALTRSPRIRQRLFTPDEIAYCEKYRFYERHYAARWAAKEAVCKALGCGLLQWNGVEVLRKPRHAPTVRIFGKIERFASVVGVEEGDLYISITHSELSAIAVCTIRKDEENVLLPPPPGR